MTEGPGHLSRPLSHVRSAALRGGVVLRGLVRVGGGAHGGQTPGGGGNGPKKGVAGQQVIDESIRVSLGRLEKLSDFIGELVILQTVLNQHRTEIQSQLLQRLRRPKIRSAMILMTKI